RSAALPPFHSFPTRRSSDLTPFLNGERFDLEGIRVLRVAFEMVCIALRTGDCDDHVKQAIATKLIALVKAGERNPDILCEEVLRSEEHTSELQSRFDLVCRL